MRGPVQAAPGQGLLGKARPGGPDERMRRRQQQEVHERAQRTDSTHCDLQQQTRVGLTADAAATRRRGGEHRR